MPLKAPVIKTTGVLICNPRNVLPYRQSMEVDPLVAAFKDDRDQSRCLH
jgi:hypothetical protein